MSSIQKFSKEQLEVISTFIDGYKFYLQAKEIQDQYSTKHLASEQAIVKFYYDITQIDPDHAETLVDHGLYDVRMELEKYIEKWDYETLPVFIKSEPPPDFFSPPEV